jgi:hypothetical protein
MRYWRRELYNKSAKVVFHPTINILLDDLTFQLLLDLVKKAHDNRCNECGDKGY